MNALMYLSECSYVSGGHFISEKEWIHPARLLTTNVLLVGYKGDAHIKIGNEDYHLRSGEVLILPAAVRHSGITETRDVSYFWFHFVESETASVNSQTITLPIHSELLQPGKAVTLANQLLDLQENPLSDHRYLSLMLNCLLHEVQIQHRQRLFKAGTDKGAAVYSIIEWIRTHLSEAFTLDDLTANFPYNKAYLCRLFKNVTGETIIEYTNKMRINLAKSTLLSRNDTIKEVAYQCGFTDDKYFMRLFKTHTNMTPTAFRQSFARKHINIK